MTSTAGELEPGSVSSVARASPQRGRAQPAGAPAPSSFLAPPAASPVFAGTVSAGVARPSFCLFRGERACRPRPLLPLVKSLCVVRRTRVAFLSCPLSRTPQQSSARGCGVGRARAPEREGPRARPQWAASKAQRRTARASGLVRGCPGWGRGSGPAAQVGGGALGWLHGLGAGLRASCAGWGRGSVITHRP